MCIRKCKKHFFTYFGSGEAPAEPEPEREPEPKNWKLGSGAGAAAEKFENPGAAAEPKPKNPGSRTTLIVIVKFWNSINWKNSNARRFINYYALKWYEILYKSHDPPKNGVKFIFFKVILKTAWLRKSCRYCGFYWEDGDPLIFSNWYGSNPNDYYYDCVSPRPAYNNGQWIDMACTSLYFGICL